MNSLRRLIIRSGALCAALSARTGWAQVFLPPKDLSADIARLTNGAAVQPGRVTLELPALAENGNSVPFTVRVESPMSAKDHVKAVYVFAERNPRPLVVTFHFQPQSGRAEVTTRIRLAGTQRVLAIAAMSDGTFWSGRTNVVVTAAACLDEALG
jgi:sulfur-oxidizing protein SoxY